MEQHLLEIFGSYMSWKMDEDTWVISFMGGTQYMYLLEGNEKALLIDTGYGPGNLKEFVETLTKKPILVVNTHFHPDHSAGNGEFEEVYMSKGETVDYLSIEGQTPFDLTKLPYPDYKKCHVKENDTFELGGRTVEVIDVLPAHCNSSLFFFDKGHGMFFCGDELESSQALLFDNSNNPEAPYDVEQRLDNHKVNMQKIKTYQSDIKYLLPNHNGCPIALSYIDDAIELVDHIYLGDATMEDKLNHRFIEMAPVAPELCRVRWKKSSIFIKKAEVMQVYGTK